ncbi:MAG: hypothetical protein KBT33_12205 [Prevotellaceae bacterium]|nr:hypothetical protein [Candidatus Minthosoma equi]
MIDNLYAQRSYVKCISEGYKFLADNLMMVIKVMTPYFLIASVMLVMFNAVNTHVNVSDMAGQDIELWEVVVDAVLLILVVLAFAFAYRRMYVMFKRLCANSVKPETGDTEKAKPSYKKMCKTFFKYFGKIVGTSLLSLFGVVVMSAVVYLPYVVATYAYFGSVEGEVNFGDTVLIPTYGYIMMFVVCTLCYTIINIFSVAFFATLLFLYGDIKTR